jgi:subtilisin family serine protease
MCRKYFYCFIFIIIFIFANCLQGQVSLRDVYGNPLPSTWPPPDSTYEHNSLTIWFNRNAINKEFLCNYWYNYYNPPKIESDDNKNEKLLTGPYTDAPGCFNLTPLLFTDYELFHTLDSLGAKTLCQYSLLNPCEDTLALTHYGYYIRTPEFWNSFYVSFDSNISLAALLALLLKYGGTKIDFAELNFYIELDSHREPNDSKWGEQTNFLDTSFAENIVGAWDIETGKREIKVAVIDDGVDFTHPDFGSGKGEDYPIVSGEYLIKDSKGLFRCLPYDTSCIKLLNHGTGVAGFIGVKTDNVSGIAGIAGGWGDSLGVSLYSMAGSDEPGLGSSLPIKNQLTIDAVSSTYNLKDTFNVHIINCCWHIAGYSEEIRRVIDYAYRLGVVTCANKSNYGDLTAYSPSDVDYNKVICVGGYGVYQKIDTLSSLVPSKIYPPSSDPPCDNSNFGYGLDLLGFSDVCSRPEVISNLTLKSFRDNGGFEAMDGTSAAIPQVTGVVALILSYFSHIDHSRFHNYEIHQDSLIKYLSPEDVEGLLCISAYDCKYNFLAYDIDSNKYIAKYDTIGYDSRTGYGILKGGETLEKLLAPKQLNHYKSIGGKIVETTVIDTFIVTDNYEGDWLIEPTKPSDLAKYKAYRYRVQDTIVLEGWEIARSWGRGGDGTVGWSGAMPLDPGFNRTLSTGVLPVGYCRIVGDAMPGDNNFNPNNIRDISFRNDSIILETFCYKVYQRPDTNAPYVEMRIFPVEPDSVVFRYSIWGDSTVVSVEDDKRDILIKSVDCEVRNVIGEPRVYINYLMEKSGPVLISIYNNLGNLVYSYNRNFWSDDGNNTHSASLKNFPSGVYHIVVTGNNSISRCSFNIAR